MADKNDGHLLRPCVQHAVADARQLVIASAAMGPWSTILATDSASATANNPLRVAVSRPSAAHEDHPLHLRINSL